MQTIKNIPILDRPREKLLRSGPNSLTDIELIAAILGNGTKYSPVSSLAKQVLKIINEHNFSITAKDLLSLKGLGEAKTSLILAAIEFAKRRLVQDGTLIHKPSDVVSLLQHLKNHKQEVFTCFSLNGAMEIISQKIVTIGLVNRTLVHPREVFSEPITQGATSIIVAHNHPSGNLNPSQQDIDITSKLITAGNLLGIELLDHIIFGRKGYLSLSEAGLLCSPKNLKS